MDSTELLPGDVIEIPINVPLPCDSIIISGSALLNESILTGESMP